MFVESLVEVVLVIVLGGGFALAGCYVFELCLKIISNIVLFDLFFVTFEDDIIAQIRQKHKRKTKKIGGRNLSLLFSEAGR